MYKIFQNALDYLNTDGAAALMKAQNRSETFGRQSKQMSNIAQESRLLTEKLEKESKNIIQVAKTAYDRSSEVNKLAKDGLGQQSNIRFELIFIIFTVESLSRLILGGFFLIDFLKHGNTFNNTY